MSKVWVRGVQVRSLSMRGDQSKRVGIERGVGSSLQLEVSRRCRSVCETLKELDS